MAAVLPYAFDTSRVVRTILRGVAALELVAIVPGIVYSVVMSRGLLAVALLAVCGLMLLAFGWIVARSLDASTGIVAADSVAVEPMTFCGVRLPGPNGTFPIASFREVRVVQVSARVDTVNPSTPSTRVYLVGHPGMPELLIARAESDEGVVLGHDLSTALRLPCTESSAPY